MHAHGQGVRWLDLSARGAVLCCAGRCAGSQHGVLAVAVEPAGRAAVRRRGPLPAAAARGVACTDGALGRRDRHAANVGAGGDSCGLRAIGLSPSRGAALCAESKSIARPCRAVYQIRSLVTKRNRPLASVLTGELARQAKSYCGFFVQRGERRDLDLISIQRSCPNFRSTLGDCSPRAAFPPGTRENRTRVYSRTLPVSRIKVRCTATTIPGHPPGLPPGIRGAVPLYMYGLADRPTCTCAHANSASSGAATCGGWMNTGSDYRGPGSKNAPPRRPACWASLPHCRPWRLRALCWALCSALPRSRPRSRTRARSLVLSRPGWALQ